uniref:Uncharacterized protein n=1 Tax=Triticum urartu TaxID=4572 RepID=A0A8R7NXW7_TRIUA
MAEGQKKLFEKVKSMSKYIFWNTNTLSKSMLASFGTCVLQNKRNILSLLFHAAELLNELMDAMGREQNLKKLIEDCADS